MEVFLEILRHSGPARLGKMHYAKREIPTPNFFSILTENFSAEHDIYLASSDLKTEKEPVVFDYGSLNVKKRIGKFGILPDEHVGFDVPRKLAELSVEKTIKFAKRYPAFGAVIQGSRYLDRREKCAEELWHRQILAIANGKKLIRNPRMLMEVVTMAREKISPNSLLYFPFAPPHTFHLLAYMGVDIFDSGDCMEKAAEKKFSTLRGALNLNELKELPCTCSACENTSPEKMKTDKLFSHNFNMAAQAVKEVRECIRSNTLREVVEEKAGCSVSSMVMLRLLDREKKEFLEKYTDVA